MKRNLEIKIRFTRSELDALNKKARKTGMSREGYCRAALNGAVVREAPPVEYYALIRELKRIGGNIDQILKIANSRGLLDVPTLRKALENNRAVEKSIREAFFPLEG